MSKSSGPFSFSACAFSVAVEWRQCGEVSAKESAMLYQRNLGWDADKLLIAAKDSKYQPKSDSALRTPKETAG